MKILIVIVEDNPSIGEEIALSINEQLPTIHMKPLDQPEPPVTKNNGKLVEIISK